MMKTIVFFFTYILIVPTPNIAQQKQVIDTGMLYTWSFITGDAVLSRDGQYAAFTINHPLMRNKTLVVRSTTGIWIKEFTSSKLDNAFFFSGDSKRIYWKMNDSLMMQDLGKDKVLLLGRVEMFSYPRIKKGDWITYRKKDIDDKLFLLQTNTSRQTIFKNVKEATFDDNGNSLLMSIDNENETNSLVWLDLKEEKATTIWSGDKKYSIRNFQFDKIGKQVAFIVSDSFAASVYCYKSGMPEASKRLDHTSRNLPEGVSINQVNGFSANCRWLFVDLKKPNVNINERDPRTTRVDIWDYRDEILQSEEPYINSSMDLVIDTDSYAEGIVLNKDGVIGQGASGTTGDHCIFSSDTLPDREYWWPHSPRPTEWLVSLKDGSRHDFLKEHGDIVYLSISPGGRWITWWDRDQASWFSYNIAMKETFNISKHVPSNLANDFGYPSSTFSHPVSPIAGWFKDDSALLLYDNYDIWKVDPSCAKAPVNITDGYGIKNKIQLRIALERDYLDLPRVYEGNENLILAGFNSETKYNGFLEQPLTMPGEIRLLSMGPHTFYRHPSQFKQAGMKIKEGGEKSKIWIVMRQSATECPNYFITRDFQKFTPLTALAPQRDYNWLTTELVTWTLPDGRNCQGVLYKPENIDSTKKYPLIFNYYEKYSHKMYEFQFPALTVSNINVPWFVSRGYLVFQPDIYYRIGSETGVNSGEYALNAIESAIEKLKERDYIDTEKLAIQGHSFGGFETNYILTHSDKFAAAAANAGFTDIMSSYLTLFGVYVNSVDQFGRQQHIERNHQLYGATPWEKPKLYFDNSPVWSANNVSAPLLMFHNKRDEQVQWRQGVEMYMALRRLGKPCWMLQYDNSMHVLTQKDGLDYTIRLTQFFDHYLKDRRAPKWMTKAVGSHMKAIQTGYNLDTSGNCSISCKVCLKSSVKN